MTEQKRQTNCVLLHDDDRAADASLLEQLRARCWRTEPTKSVHEAFARLCLQERLESARSAWGLERHFPPVLVIAVELSAQIHAQLLAACDQYLPGIGIWQWERGELTVLRAAAAPPRTIDNGADAVQSGRTAPAARPVPTSFNGPMLRFHEPPDDAPRTGAHHSADDDESEHGQGDDAAAPLSSDEVSMLLGSEQEPPRS